MTAVAVETMNELEVAPNVPPDWRDWINNFPSVKSIALTCVGAWIISPLVMVWAGYLIASGFVEGKEAIDGIIKLVDIWLNALNWLTAAAVFGVIGKRFTEDADVVRAQGEVKAKTIVAAAQAKATLVTAEHAIVDPTIVETPMKFDDNSDSR